MGKLNVRVGAMASIKTTEMIALSHNYEEVGCLGIPIILKPYTDTKGSDRIVSRTGISRSADIVLPRRNSLLKAVSDEILRRSVERPDALIDDTLLVIDEAQFLTVRQAEEAHSFAVARAENAVIAAGIRLDAMGVGFPAMDRFMNLAHDIQIRDTWCRCKRRAFYNTRKDNGKFTFIGSQVAVDGERDGEHSFTYQSLCRSCYTSEVLQCIDAGEPINSTTLAILGLRRNGSLRSEALRKLQSVVNTTDK